MKIVTFLFTLIFLFFSCKSKSTLTIAASSNMQFVLENIVKEFEIEKGIDVNLVVGSTGKLTTAIEHGAPYDLFIAANVKYPTYLFNKGFTINFPQIYAYGQVVLWSLNDNISLNLLKSDSVKSIAIPNPKTAPYGEWCVSYLKREKLFEYNKSKFVFGESVSQCNQYVLTESVAIGFTSLSVVLSKPMLGIGKWVKIESEGEPIAQGMVLIKRSDHKDEARLFHDYLLSKKNQNILKNNGYLID